MRIAIAWLLLTGGLALSGCSSAAPSGDPDDQQVDKPGAAVKAEGGDDSPDGKVGQAAKAAKAAKHVRDVELARRKLTQARLEQEADEKKHRAAIDQSGRELSLADEALEQFTLYESPMRVKKAELELKEQEDGLAENLEEFEQLKLMYAEQDLADKTRELVVHRTERRIEQKRKELELARTTLEQLKTGDLAQERAKLALEVSEKQHAADAAQLDAYVAANEKALAVLSAEHDLADAEADVADADAKGDGDADKKADDKAADGKEDEEGDDD